ncbi:MAG: hypothetical protein HFG74_05585 [Hungatella sp.]|nr:hypothetical protein [Hungatella sp.]
MKEIEFDIYIHMTGTVEAESDSADNLLDAIFPDGYEGVADGISTNPRFLPEGYIHVFDMDE